MQRTNTLFIIVGSILGIGIILSFYGNHIIFQDLSKGEDKIKLGKNLTILSEIKNKDTRVGVYAIQIVDFRDGIITAKILDPLENEIEFQPINKQVFEGRFNISHQGIYKLIIENLDENEIQVFGVIGPDPDAGKKSLGFISLYILVIGLIGMIIVTIYVIKLRRKS